MFEGVKNAFPMYILSPDEVVDRILNAIRQEEQQVVIPYRGNVVFLVRMLPVSFVDFMGKVFGIGNTMDDFKGRGSITSRIPGIKIKKSK